MVGESNGALEAVAETADGAFFVAEAAELGDKAVVNRSAFIRLSLSPCVKNVSFSCRFSFGESDVSTERFNESAFPFNSATAQSFKLLPLSLFPPFNVSAALWEEFFSTGPSSFLTTVKLDAWLSIPESKLS